MRERELHACTLNSLSIGAAAPNHLKAVTAEEKTAICALLPNGYLREHYAGTESMEDLYARCKATRYPCVNWASFMSCIDGDLSTERLTHAQWRQKFLCADTDGDDCLDPTEFESLINAQGTIDSLAFAEPGTVDAVE